MSSGQDIYREVAARLKARIEWAESTLDNAKLIKGGPEQTPEELFLATQAIAEAVEYLTGKNDGGGAS